MNVSAVGATGPGLVAASAQAGGHSQAIMGDGILGKDDFLKLLLAQLQNQDPLKPMEDREFITQLAQFRSLEEMENLNLSLMAMLDMQQVSQASSLIGKTVEAMTGQGYSTITGVVSEVDLSGGAAVLVVDGQRVYLHDVIRVR